MEGLKFFREFYLQRANIIIKANRQKLFILILVFIYPVFVHAQTIEEGTAQYERGNLEQAIKIFEALEDLDNKNAEVLTWLGKLYLKKGEFSRAERILKRAVSADKTYVPAYIERAKLEMNRPRKPDDLRAKAAQKFLEQALELSPKTRTPTTHFLRYIINLKTRRKHLPLLTILSITIRRISGGTSGWLNLLSSINAIFSCAARKWKTTWTAPSGPETQRRSSSFQLAGTFLFAEIPVSPWTVTVKE